MRNAVRLLERRLACLVAQAALGPVVDDYVDRWRAAVELGGPPPDVLIERSVDVDLGLDPRGCDVHLVPNAGEHGARSPVGIGPGADRDLER